MNVFLNLPIDFVSTIKNTLGADGEQFLANLPALIAEASAQWGIENNTGWKDSTQFAEDIAEIK